MDKETKKAFKETNELIENLAVMVKKGFDETAKKVDVDQRFERVEKRLEHIDEGLNYANARLSSVEHDVGEIRESHVRRSEFVHLSGRVMHTEKKLGIKIGK